MARPADPHAKEALLAAAQAEFAKSSLATARVEDITAACGLSKGAFYLHFKSKEAAFEELVNRFISELGTIDGQRIRRHQAFVAERGAITARDSRMETARYRDFTALEVQLDEAVLELLWGHRLTLGTLLRGCGGTPFEGMLIQLLEGEARRVAQDVAAMQGCSACRRDVPPDMVGDMVVGTYFLAAARMISATEKPDLHALAVNLHHLLHDGLKPTGSEPKPRAKAEKKSGARSHA